MPKPFKAKVVKGKKVKQLSGSSKLKLEKRAEQRRLMRSGDWKGLMERYETLNTLHGTAIIIKQRAFEKEEPIVIRPWTDLALKGKIKHFRLAYMEKNELVTVSKHYSIPLRLIERMQRRERQKEVEKFRVKKNGEKISIDVIHPEGEFRVRIPPEKKNLTKPFEKYSNKDLERVHEELGIPVWLLRMLREREGEKIGKARRFIKKIQKK